MSRKYVVFKAKDWEEFTQRITLDPEIEASDCRYALASLMDREIDDAEVIRCQDITSAPIFFAYSSIIRSYMELMDQASVFHRGSEVWEELEMVADHFYDAAVKAEKWPMRKLPDL